ncbi:Collagen type IV alpha-3-binding protein [Orchesella cincta]|uniref:Collagen type IV alpha-3-binding protein n=1 Tax=Orchesella cincta TaxID=48709 RepID=A0A1D2MID6_ORCCI|nr:Collagen type IV alpha-3-binding protein [Orchesella cincta]
MTILESVSEDTLVFLQIHKRVWPAAQRDALFWSHIRSAPDARDSDGPRTWIVCNHSTDHDKAPECKNGKYIKLLRYTGCLIVISRIDYRQSMFLVHPNHGIRSGTM